MALDSSNFLLFCLAVYFIITNTCLSLIYPLTYLKGFMCRKRKITVTLMPTRYTRERISYFDTFYVTNNKTICSL